MQKPSRAKLVGGVWLPEDETHLVEMMLHNPRGTVFRDGKATYQIHKLDACLARLPRNSFAVCVDVGAHVGLWSMWLAKAFRKVHAFEPMGQHADLFQLNVSDENVVLHRMALGDKPGFCKVMSVGESSGDAFVKPGTGNVEIRTLDSFAFEEIDFVKIDVEGFERQVVEGGRDTLLRNKPLICIEQKDKEVQNFGGTPKAALSYLFEMGMIPIVEIHGDHILGWRG